MSFDELIEVHRHLDAVDVDWTREHTAMEVEANRGGK
jgi:hypothetical protein